LFNGLTAFPGNLENDGEARYNYSIETLLDKLTEDRPTEIVSLTGFNGEPSKEVQFEKMDLELLELYQDLDKQSF